MVEVPELANLGSIDSKSNPIIYHYCSLQTFLSIIENQSFRLSDINTLNDFSEVHWAYARFMEAAHIDGKSYSADLLDYVDKIISEMQTHTLPLVGCFSKDADVLSQWRAYADNGAGVSIGFDTSVIENLSIRCAPVEYDYKKQVLYFSILLDSLVPIFDNGIQNEQWVAEYIQSSAFDMCLIKNPAFSEEKEVRIIRAVVVDQKNGILRISDNGGVGSDKLAKKGHPIKFRVRNGGLIAHIDLTLGANRRTAIKEVVLGPRSESGPNEIGMALSANGFEGFKVTRSAATYR